MPPAQEVWDIPKNENIVTEESEHQQIIIKKEEISPITNDYWNIEEEAEIEEKSVSVESFEDKFENQSSIEEAKGRSGRMDTTGSFVIFDG